MGVGITVGKDETLGVAVDGQAVGALGRLVGVPVGERVVGATVEGTAVGKRVGVSERYTRYTGRCEVGITVGRDGRKVGTADGDCVVGVAVGINVGVKVGMYDGVTVGEKLGK